ncbi:tripartite tricarboxylate transporter substrate binding protein [Bordetella pertussis]|uniref:tripartite tricarboxylate transporter substrate binding protein n=1 Tax=Bordetella pertussis TaxID=520 RepID=UPI0005E493B7|nr:tripartite tricarboxylate transporter substrate binding protein [Bordetella pertussis]CFP37974.1 putattive exported protein [Bordetella pertussis]
MQRRSFLAKVAHIAAAVGVSACAATSSFAAPGDFPNKPLDIIVTFPPGGGTDMLARLIGNYLTESLGQTAVVENRPGASGNVGARLVADRAPDGYSLLMVNSSFAVNPGVFRNLPFDPKKDFAAVINVAYVPSVFVVPAGSKYKTLGELMAAAKQTNTQVTYGSCGNGTPQHLAGELLNVSAKTHMVHVPYKGCGPALNDVLGSQIGLAVVTASSAIPFIKAGKLQALAVTSKERSALLPEVPTVAEQGVAGYELNQWHGLLVPGATPMAVRQKLYDGIAKVMQRDDVQKKLADLGYSTASDGPEVFQKMVETDIDRFSALTKQIGLKVD